MPDCITIYTDASHCCKTKTGGWACWVKVSKYETFQSSGFFKTPVYDSTDAELRAIANALSCVIKTLDVKGKILVVVTDSSMAIDYIKLNVKRPRRGRLKEGRRLRSSIATLINGMIPKDCQLKLNKVKAHSKSDGARSYVNDIVDKAARKTMREGRRKKTLPI